MENHGLVLGQAVTVRCPVVKNGYKQDAIYKGNKNLHTAYVQYLGNKRSSTIAFFWIVESDKYNVKI